jgi:hypothetical protein
LPTERLRSRWEQQVRKDVIQREGSHGKRMTNEEATHIKWKCLGKMKEKKNWVVHLKTEY